MYPHKAGVRCSDSGAACHTAPSARCWCWVKYPSQVASSPVTDQVGVISWRTDADRLGGPSKEITKIVHQILDYVCRVPERWCHPSNPKNLVVNNIIMSGTRSPLECRVGLQEEIPVASLCHSAIHDGPILRIGRSVGVVLFGGIEPCVVALPDNDYAYSGEAFLGCICWIEILVCLTERR